MKEFEPKGTPKANKEARKRLIESLGEDSSITDKELIFKHGNPSAKEVDKVIESLEWQEHDKEYSQKMEQTDRFLFYCDQRVKEWETAVNNMKGAEDEAFLKSKVIMYNQMLKDEQAANNKWKDYKDTSTEMQQQIYRNLGRTMKRLISELASSLKRNN